MPPSDSPSVREVYERIEMLDIKQTIAMTLGAIAALIVPLVTDDHQLNTLEWFNLGLGIVGAISTYVVPNLDTTVGRYAKQVVAGLVAALTLLPTLTADGVTFGEWLQVIVIALGAAGVIALPGPVWTNATPVRGPVRTVRRQVPPAA